MKEIKELTMSAGTMASWPKKQYKGTDINNPNTAPVKPAFARCLFFLKPLNIAEFEVVNWFNKIETDNQQNPRQKSRVPKINTLKGTEKNNVRIAPAKPVYQLNLRTT